MASGPLDEIHAGWFATLRPVVLHEMVETGIASHRLDVTVRALFCGLSFWIRRLCWGHRYWFVSKSIASCGKPSGQVLDDQCMTMHSRSRGSVSLPVLVQEKRPTAKFAVGLFFMRMDCRFVWPTRHA
jgi:hypothetical protein